MSPRLKSHRSVYRLGWRDPRLYWAALGLAIAAAAVFLLYEGRHTTLHYDEWRIFLTRRSFDVDTFLRPYNQHLSLVPIALWKTLFATIGVEPYVVYRLIPILGVSACAVLLFVFGRERVGAAAALAPPVLLLFLGPGSDDLFQPWSFNLTGACAAGLGALLLLDRRSDVAAAALLALGLATSSLGLPFAVAAAVSVFLSPDRWRRIWIVAIPLALYGLWVLAYGNTTFLRSNIGATPAFAANLAAASVAAPTGLGLDWGRPLAILLAIVLVRRLSTREASPWLWTVVTAGIVYWSITGLARAHNTPVNATRFVFPGTIFVFLIVLELARGAHVSRRGLALLAAATAAALVSNTALLHRVARGFRDNSDLAAAELGALELARGVVPPDFRWDLRAVPSIPSDPTFTLDLVPERYFSAVDAYGSPADQPSDIVRRREPIREAADLVLAQAFRLSAVRGVVGSGAGGTPVVERIASGRVVRRDRCLRFLPAARTAALEVRLPRGGLGLRVTAEASAKTQLRRFADAYTVSVEPPPSGGSSWLIRVPKDAKKVSQAWHARVSSPRPITLCGV